MERSTWLMRPKVNPMGGRPVVVIISTGARVSVCMIWMIYRALSSLGASIALARLIGRMQVELLAWSEWHHASKWSLRVLTPLSLAGGLPPAMRDPATLQLAADQKVRVGHASTERQRTHSNTSTYVNCISRFGGGGSVLPTNHYYDKQVLFGEIIVH